MTTTTVQPHYVFAVRGRVGFILMCIWFMLTGLIAILGLSMRELPVIMGILAFLSGFLQLIGV